MINEISNNKYALFALPKSNRTLELYKNSILVEKIDHSSDYPDNLSTKDIFLRTFHFDENGFMHSRKITDEGFRWDKNAVPLEGWDFVMQFAEKYPDCFLYIPKALLNYHQRFGGDGLVSNTSYHDWGIKFEYIYQKHKNDKMLQGQTWYPERIKRYKRLQYEFEKGMIPEPHLRYFIHKK